MQKKIKVGDIVFYNAQQVGCNVLEVDEVEQLIRVSYTTTPFTNPISVVETLDYEDLALFATPTPRKKTAKAKAKTVKAKKVTKKKSMLSTKAINESKARAALELLGDF